MCVNLGGVIQVIAVCSDDVPNATTGITYVTDEAWDDMDVQMINGLAGCDARIEAHIESIGVMQLVDFVPHGINKFKDVGALARRSLPPVSDLSPGHHKSVSWGNWVAVPNRKR